MKAKKNEKEHLFTNLLRNAEDTQTAIDFSFMCTSRSKCYLAISEKGIVDKEKLAFLLQKIFASKLSPEHIDEICDFYNRMSYQSMIKVYENLDDYASKERRYYNVMREALLEFNRRYF